MKLNHLRKARSASNTFLATKSCQTRLYSRLRCLNLMARCERALEIGCGFGNGIQLIREHFGAGHITAVDIDPEWLLAAQSRWQARPQGLKGLSFGCRRLCLPFADGEFDMVFDFAVFHHIPDWQAANGTLPEYSKPTVTL